MQIETIGIFGGTGFVGSVLANQLAEQGKNLALFTRSRDRARRLWMLPNTQVIEMDNFDEANISAKISGCDAVVNLAGILNEKGDNGTGFRQVHTELTRSIVKSCFNADVGRYVHMSALGAAPFAPSYYLRTKGEAENAAMAAHDEGLNTTVFRPSVIFGPDDKFYNRFAELLRISPLFFPLACPHTKFQPTYVGDVSQAIVQCLSDRSTFGSRYDLGGPETTSLIEIVRDVAQLTGNRRVILPLGKLLSRIQANVLEYFPGKPFSRDNLRSASEDSVILGDSGYDLLGIQATRAREVVPKYLGGKFERKRFYDFRAVARRIP